MTQKKWKNFHWVNFEMRISFIFYILRLLSENIADSVKIFVDSVKILLTQWKANLAIFLLSELCHHDVSITKPIIND